MLHAFLPKTQNIVKNITWSERNHPSLKTIDWVHQTRPMKGA